MIPTCTLAVLAFALAPSAGQAEPPKEPAKKEVRVKTTTVRLSGTRKLKGVVDKIDADGLTLVETPQFGQPIEHVLLPIDHLRNGKVLPDVWPRFAYRWEDLKRGDTAELCVSEDRIDKQMYCLEVSIERRPKEKLPPSQLEDKDEYYPWHRIFNEIENGEDVSDEEIAKVFPPRAEKRDDKGRLLRSATPGGLGKEYQEKLDKIRVKKKAKDPKAKPSEKK